jgi:ubiquinone/menaquinone biosynthesis C-methylase UbiE
MMNEDSDTYYRRRTAAWYDAASTGVEGDTAFYVEEALRAGSPVLELGCGTGRVLIPVAEAGVEIAGLDRSPDMLAVARQKIAALPEETQRRIELVEGDMRDFALDRRFNLAMIPYRAFLHLLTVEDQRRALGCIREHLADEGRLVFNIFDPSVDIIAAHRGPQGGTIKRNVEFTDPHTGHPVVVWDSRRYDMERQRIEVMFLFEEMDKEGKVLSKTYSSFTLRFVYRYEMAHLLELCGFQVEEFYGDFRRGPFRHGGEQVWIARKAGKEF